MKFHHIKTFLSIGLVSASLMSCDKFLDKTDKDIMIPESVEQYRQILRGEGYSSDYQKKFNWIHYMNDDIEIYYTNITRDETSDVTSKRPYFQWKKELEDETRTADPSYGALYKHILACNVIINAESMTGTEADKNLLLAQAYTLRAYYYFMLVNLYAKPYHATTASTDPGVSIWTDSKPTLERLKRSSVAETYELINSDIDKALDLFNNALKPNNTFEVSREAALLLASRIALYQEQYERVIEYGTSLLNKASVLHNLNSTDITFTEAAYSFISQRQNPEILFNFGDVQASFNYMYSLPSSNLGSFFQVSQFSDNNLMSLFDETDMRRKAFFLKNSIGGYKVIKYSRTPSLAKGEAWRTAEAYLNLAEAYARKIYPDQDEAINLINVLRNNRIANNEAWKTGDFSSREELVEAIWEERRRELCFEEIHRWWDLRRQGMPELTHTVHYKGGNTEVYKLEKNDPNYTLEIPRNEREYNPSIQLNNRVEKNPVN